MTRFRSKINYNSRFQRFCLNCMTENEINSMKVQKQKNKIILIKKPDNI